MRETFMNAVMRWSFGGGSEAFIRSVRALMGAGVASALLWSGAVTQGTPPGFEGKPWPSYPGQPTDCYLLLKSQWPYEGGDEPACRAVLANLNKFCDEPPQYNRRKLHPTTKNLWEPNWSEMNAIDNMELVKNTYLAHVLPEYKSSLWNDMKERIMDRVSDGKFRLLRADIVNADVRGGVQTVYMLERNELELPGTSQPYLMFSDRGQVVPHPLFSTLSLPAAADLWAFRKQWFLIHFYPVEKRFIVKEIIRPQAGPDASIGATLRCTIRHINDHHGVR